MIALPLILVIGCSNKDSAPVQEQLSEPAAAPEFEEETPPDLEDVTVGEGSLDPEEEQPFRNRQRMNLDQLRASMEQLTGGVIWKSGNSDLWSKYSSTLGVPDYKETVNEDLTSSVIFQKFLADAAIYSCQQWIDNDLVAPEKRFFVEADLQTTDEQAIRANIGHLRYLIHGKSSEEADSVIDAYLELYELVLQRNNDPTAAWNTVCVAFFTHPDFFTY